MTSLSSTPDPLIASRIPKAAPMAIPKKALDRNMLGRNGPLSLSMDTECRHLIIGIVTGQGQHWRNRASRERTTLLRPIPGRVIGVGHLRLSGGSRLVPKQTLAPSAPWEANL